MNRRESASSGVSAIRVGGQRICCSPKYAPPMHGSTPGLVSIALYSAMRETGPLIWTQPLFRPGVTRLSWVKESSPFSSSQEVARHGIEVHAEGVPDPVGED